MDDLSTLLIVLIPLCPLAACAATPIAARWLGSTRAGWPAQFACAAMTVCSVLVMVDLVQAAQFSMDPIELYTWMSVGGATGFDAVLELSVDRLSAAMLTLVSFVGWMIATAMSRGSEATGDKTALGTAFCFTLFAVAMLLLSAGFLQWLLFWQLATAGLFLCHVVGNRSAEAAAAARRILLLHLSADIPLVIGVFMVWVNFGTFEFEQVLGNAARLGALAESEPAVVNTLCLCLLVPVVVRCAQFPVFGWLDWARTMPASINAVLQSAITIPPAVYLLVRTYPLFSSAVDVRMLMATLGAMTVLLAAIVAVFERDRTTVLSYTTAGFAGLALLGIASGQSLGLVAAVWFVVVHSVVKAVLILTGVGESHSHGSTEERRRLDRAGTAGWLQAPLLVVATVVLTSGLGGSNLILSAVWDVAEVDEVVSSAAIGDSSGGDSFQAASEPAAGDRWFGFPTSVSFMVFLVVTAGSLAVLAMALFRVLLTDLQGGHTSSVEHREAASRPAGALFIQSLGILVAIGVGALGVVRLDWAADLVLGESAPPIAVAADPWLMRGLGLFVMLLGAIAAWMSVSAQTPIERHRGTLGRLADNRFYLDQMLIAAVSVPLRVAAQLASLTDWLVIDGAIVGVPRRLTAAAGRAVRPLQNGVVQMYAVSTLLAAGVLLAALLWLQG